MSLSLEHSQTPRRSIFLLAISQAFYSCCSIVVIGTSGIVGLTLAPERDLATLPVTSWVVGSMLSTIPASLLMRRIGRKPVFMGGSALAMLGAVLAVMGIMTTNFWLFCGGCLLLGSFQATSNFYRFAAAERAEPADKPIAISWVLTGGVVAAVIGTLIVSHTATILPPFTYAGSFIAVFFLALGNILVISRTLLPMPTTRETYGPQRNWVELLQQPRLIVAMSAAMISYALMNLMMTAAPVAMSICGFAISASASVIQWHVLGMYVPSFFTGLLIKHFGVDLITALGVAMLIAAGIVGYTGITLGHFSMALILLGLGWNFGFIGGTTMLTNCYRPQERAKVQAVNDFGISLLMTIASFSSGQMLAHWGWHSVPLVIFPFALAVFALVMWATRLTSDSANDGGGERPTNRSQVW